MTPLKREIVERIAQDGPITVARYVALCLGHPRYGYYATRDPFGAAGDFVTAPEISQMFGELLGLWAAEVWRLMGEPTRVALIELGPGRGTLMADALRAAKASPGFFDAVEVTLVETSPTLRAVQERMLAGAGKPVKWAETVEEALDPYPSPCKGEGDPARSDGSGGDRAGSSSTPETPPDPAFSRATLPTPAQVGCFRLEPDLVGQLRNSGVGRARGGITAPSADDGPGSAAGVAVRDDGHLPVIVLANEFFDALPVRQFIRTASGWRERMIGLADDGALAFGLAAEPPSDLRLPDRPEGFILELNPDGLAIAARLGAHVAAHGGAVLSIDYGDAASAGDTLQAVRAHGFADPLQTPGEADLTVQVDFGALAHAAAGAGAAPMRLLPQADLLERIGLAQRAARLKRAATPAQAAAIDAAVARLTDRSVTGMGALFKALAFADPRLGALPAFESPDGVLE